MNDYLNPQNRTETISMKFGLRDDGVIIDDLINKLEKTNQKFIEDLCDGSIFISIEFKNPKDTPQKIKTIVKLLDGKSVGHRFNRYIIKTTYQNLINLSNSKLKLVKSNLAKIFRLDLFSLCDQNLKINVDMVDGIILQLLVSDNYKKNISKIVDYLKTDDIHLEDKDFKLEIDNNGVVKSLYLFININKLNKNIPIIEKLKNFNFIFSISPIGKFRIPCF